MNRIVGRQILGLLGLLAASLLLFSASAGSVGQQDSVPSIKSKDAGERLAALHALVEAAGEDLSPLLIKMLKDKDWEIVAVAARALGDGSNPKAIKPLTSLALSGPIREVRLVATAALAKLDPDAAAQALIKKVRKESLAACEALVVLGPSLENFEVPKALWKLLEDKQLRVRSAASGAILALSHEQRVEVLKRLLASEYLGVRARALEVAERQPQWSALVVLNTLLQQPDLDPVLLRRAMPAVVATLLVKEKGAEFQDAGDLTELFSGSKKDLAEGLVKGLCHNPEAVVARRGPLLAELLLRAEWESRPDMIAATEAARNHNDPGVRAGAVRLLRFVAGHDSIHLCQELYESDRSPRVKRTAIESLLFIQPVSESASWRWIVERLASETVSELRQRLVVALGNQELAEKEDVLKALVTACDDLDWGVAACAAVSLGITRSPRAPEALNALVKTSEDWRLRGAAVVGLSKCLQKDAIMGVIAAL
ncbi:MAG: HEAT repeat protein, partial [Candidatus Paceibacteria bacterium]